MWIIATYIHHIIKKKLRTFEILITNIFKIKIISLLQVKRDTQEAKRSV